MTPGPGPPLHVIDVPWRVSAAWGWVALSAVAIVASLAFAEAVARGKVPWAPDGVRALLDTHDERRSFHRVVLVTLAGLTFLFRARMRRTSGRAELHEERVLFLDYAPWRRRDPVAVDWKDVVGFRDASSDFITLVVQDAMRPAPPRTIPTPTEADRVAVLEILDRRGLRRLDA